MGKDKSSWTAVLPIVTLILCWVSLFSQDFVDTYFKNIFFDREKYANKSLRKLLAIIPTNELEAYEYGFQIAEL
jgi:hypothetical protein